MFKLANSLSLCLASGSPRRRELLGSLGLPFIVHAPQCGEPEPEYAEKPGEYALRMAKNKAHAAQGAAKIVLAADTVVCIDGEILGKPRDREEALVMLDKLNGRGHVVCTGVHILMPDGSGTAFSDTSQVAFGQWPRATLRAYAATGEPMDKAGAYAIQGKGAFLVKSLTGSFSNVVGLPLSPLVQLFLDKKIIQAI